MMKRASFVLASLLALAALMAPAQAQLARSFVSAEIGNDANAPNCSRLAPCRTFQAAHDNTLDKGEVTVLDPGSYGAVTIRKNISIINDGVGEAGILVSGNHIGVFVDAPSASVTLRGLTIKGIGFGGGIGIQFSVGSALNVENCTVRNLDGQFGAGINFEPAASPVPMGVTNSLQVTNSIISDNTSNGIFIASPGGTSNVVAVLDHVGLYNNSIGLLVSGFGASGSVVMATVVESVASSNANSAFAAESVNGAGFARILLVRSAVSGNHPGNGILSNGGNAKILVNESAVYGNANGWQAINGGQLFSFGNNAIAHNGANEGPQSPLALK